MSINIKKKNLKIVGIVIGIIIILVGLFFLVQTISTNMKINETKEKLSQINAEELKTKLIEELEKTDLNVDLTLDSMFVDTIVTEGEGELEGFTVMSIMAFKNNKVAGAVEIPCFKIESDSNGNFKNIEYVAHRVLDSNIIEQTIEDVFKYSYNIDLKISDNIKYNSTFNMGLVNKGTIKTLNNDFFLAIVNRINDTDYEDYSAVEDYKEYETAKFGLDFEDVKNVEKEKQINDNAVIESDNFYGMRFNMTLAEFCENFNKELNTMYNQYTNDNIPNDSLVLAEDKFKKSTVQHKQSGLDFYMITRTFEDKGRESIVVYTEPNTKNIVSITLMADYNSFINQKEFSTWVMKVSVPCIIKSVRPDFTQEQVDNFMQIENKENNKAYNYQDNMIYEMSTNSTSKTADFTISALSEKKYEELYNSSSQNNTNTTNNTNTVETITNDNLSTNTIENGTYNKILTSEEKEDMLIELGDISIKIEGNKITLTDIDMQCTLTGTYEIEEGNLIGEYTTAEYYSHEEMKEVTQTIEDRFEFEIQENNKLYDTMGYGQFLGKCLYRNATYELVY